MTGHAGNASVTHRSLQPDHPNLIALEREHVLGPAAPNIFAPNQLPRSTMKGNFRMIDSSIFKARRNGAAALVLLVGMAAQTAAHAETTYTLSGEITSFRTWMDPTSGPVPALVNGAPLVNSGRLAGTYQGASFNWSETVLLADNTTAVDFTYDGSKVPFVPLPNRLSFAAGIDVTVNPGVPFTLGSLTFTNGQWFYLAELGVRFSATPVGGGPASEFDDTVLVISNSSLPQGPDPYRDADFFYLAGHPELGSVRVFDEFGQPPFNPGFSGTVNFIAQIGSLDPVAFEATNAAAFVSSSITPNQAGVVPEPSTWAMWLLGLAATAACAKRKSAQPSGMALGHHRA